MYTMPAFDRVRENFLKRVEDDISSKSGVLCRETDPVRNLFVHTITSLGYSSMHVESLIAELCSVDSITLDGDYRTLDFILRLFKELVKIPQPEINVAQSLNEKSEHPFQWPLVDMAEYEFGRKGKRIDMKKVIVITDLPRLACSSVNKLQDLLKNLLLQKIGTVVSVYIPVDVRTSCLKGCAFVEMSRVSEAWRAYESLDNFCWPCESGPAMEVILRMKASSNPSVRRWRVQIFRNYSRGNEAPDTISKEKLSSTTVDPASERLHQRQHRQQGQRFVRSSCTDFASEIGDSPQWSDGDHFEPTLPSMAFEDSALRRKPAKLRLSLEKDLISKLSRSLAATESAMAKMPSTSTNSEKIESGDSMVPRGNIRPSDVLTITQVGRSSVDVTFKPRNRYVDDTGAEEEDADNVEIGDDGIGESDCNVSEDGSGSGFEDALTSSEVATASAVSKEKVDNLITYMRRLKLSMSHAMLSDSMSVSTLDEMWEETNLFLEEALSSNHIEAVLRAEHQYTLALQRCVPSTESGVLSSAQGSSSPLLRGRASRHRGVQDDILESESQPYTSLDTISSLLEASVNDMAHNSTSDGSSKRTTEPTKAVRDAGESSVTGLHLMVSTLRSLALAAWVCRSEQRVIGLKRLYHQKAARASECEEHLQEAVERTRKYTTQMQQMQRRVEELQESLSYHRVATDRIRVLEAQLIDTERDRDDAAQARQALERQLKRNQVIMQQHQHTNSQAAVSRRRERESDSEIDINAKTASRLLREISDIDVDDWCTLSIEQITKLQSDIDAISTSLKDVKAIAIQRKAKELAEQQLKRDDSENALCCVCRDNMKTVLLLPCKHLCLCEECSENIASRRMTTCPVCRQTVNDILRVYV